MPGELVAGWSSGQEPLSALYPLSGALAPARAGRTLLPGSGGSAGTEGPESHLSAHQSPAPR